MNVYLKWCAVVVVEGVHVARGGNGAFGGALASAKEIGWAETSIFSPQTPECKLLGQARAA